MHLPLSLIMLHANKNYKTVLFCVGIDECLAVCFLSLWFGSHIDMQLVGSKYAASFSSTY